MQRKSSFERLHEAGAGEDVVFGGEALNVVGERRDPRSGKDGLDDAVLAAEHVEARQLPGLAFGVELMHSVDDVIQMVEGAEDGFEAADHEVVVELRTWPDRSMFASGSLSS